MPARRTARAMLQILAVDKSASAAIRLHCIEWIMFLDGAIKQEQIHPLKAKDAAKLDAGLSTLLGAEIAEKTGENHI